MISTGTAIVAILLVMPLRANDWELEARRLRPTDASASEQAVLQNLAARVKQTLDSIPRAITATQADLARPQLRRELERSLGHNRLPWPPDLQAHTVSTTQKAGYRIEKVIYQGLPGELIPANIYVPDNLQGRAPGIVFYNGHWFPDSKARPDFQAFCINMAKFGFVVMNFDTFGQGERGISRRDHRRVEGLLIGVSEQGFAFYETKVALEYLLTRADVDPQRIGMTGASGGGFNAWMTAALDDRIKVVVPVVATCDLYEQIMQRQPRDLDPTDHCHYVPGMFKFANNHELLAMAAPKKILIVSATEDQSFPVRGAREVAGYGRRLYSSYAMTDRFSYYEDSVDGHGFQKKKREAAYGWFLRWFMDKGDGSPVREASTEVLASDSPELRCFPAGQNQAAGPAMIAAVKRVAADLPPVPGSIRLQNALGPWPDSIPSKVQLGANRLERLLLPSEPGLQTPSVLLRPAGKAQGLLVAVDDRGKEAVFADAAVRGLADAGWAVLALDPRGIGEMASSKNNWLFAVSLLEGQNLVWRQAWDIHRAIEVVNAAPELRVNRIGLYARGQNAGLAATYFLAHTGETQDAKLSWFILRDAFLTYHDFLDRPKSIPLSFQLLASNEDKSKQLDREIPGSYIPFDVLDYFDIPQLLDAAVTPGLVVNPVDGDWGHKSEATSRKLLKEKVQVVVMDAPDPSIAKFVLEVAPH